MKPKSAISICLISFLFSLVLAQISVNPRAVKVTDVSVVYEEAPIVPIVFFSAGSDVVDARFNNTLRILATRMADNPDVVIEIRGYYHPIGDGATGSGELARKRAEAVKRKIVQFEPNVAERVLVQPAVDPTRPLRGKHGSKARKIQQENQRAEISVRPLNPEVIPIRRDNVKKAVAELERSGQLYRIRRLLEDNPLVFVLVEGINIGSMSEPADAFKKLRILLKRLADEFSTPQVELRIFAAMRWNEAEQQQIRLLVCPDWVIEKPHWRADVNAEAERTTIKIKAKRKGETKIFRDDGELIATAATGDWRLTTFPDPMRNYFASILLKSSSGQIERMWSKPFSFKLANDQPKSLSERLFIANYELNRLELADSRSSYANRFLIARQIAMLAQRRIGKIKVSVIGYTDETGDSERNRQMSLLWANMELNEIDLILRGYMSDEYSKLANALKSGRIELSAIGAGNSQKSGTAGKMVIDENTPEGRVAKRRVEILVEF